MKAFLEEYGITIVVATVIMGLIGTATFLKNTGGNSLKAMTNNFLQEAQLADAESEEEYQVTINLTNPKDAECFGNGTVYDGYTLSNDCSAWFVPSIPFVTDISGNTIGTFQSASDSITVTTTTGKIGIYLYAPYRFYDGTGVSTAGQINLTGASIYNANKDWYYTFEVTGNGTITLDGIGWDE